MKHEGSAFQDLSPPQRAQLELYRALLLSTAVPRGMVSGADAPKLWERHILDSLRVVPLVPEDTLRVGDLGSGAGLPGIPFAVAHPDLDVTLTEPRTMRAAFLELVIERLALRNTTVFAGPAEEAPTDLDLCLARGFGDAARAWGAASRLLRPRGRLAYWAGRTFSAQGMPSGVRIEHVVEPDLESGGPIVIMTRQ